MLTLSISTCLGGFHDPHEDVFVLLGYEDARGQERLFSSKTRDPRPKSGSGCIMCRMWSMSVEDSSVGEARNERMEQQRERNEERVPSMDDNTAYHRLCLLKYLFRGVPWFFGYVGRKNEPWLLVIVGVVN